MLPVGRNIKLGNLQKQNRNSLYANLFISKILGFIFVLLNLHRYREKDSKFTNWIELPVNPPDARNIQIHDLNANTRYEFQVIGTNEYGDGMFSEIIEASTKGKIHILFETSRNKNKIG